MLLDASNERHRVGYSAWGFLGAGVADSPDGGRCHRPVLLNGLIAAGCDIVMLQRNRDLEESGEDFTQDHLWFCNGLPTLDALILEHRWPIPGRSTDEDIGTPDYTPDVERQNTLIAHYSKRHIPIIVWDKDQKLDKDSTLLSTVIVAEPGISPRWSRIRLLFPLDSRRACEARAQLTKYAQNGRPTSLVYIG